MRKPRSIGGTMQHRETRTEKIYALLKSRAGTWVPVRALAEVGGFCAWRTRISEARELAAANDYEIVWNNDQVESAYMLRPTRIAGARAAEEQTDGQRQLPGFGGSFGR